MRIAYLCKRRYMNKDVVLDRYARLYEIPAQLARAGHTVEAWCLAYRRADAGGEWTHEAQPGALRWHSDNAFPDLPGYPLRMLRRLRAFAPDVVVAASDIPHVVLGQWLAARLGVPFVADLYDNFEGFGQARVPGMVALLRRAVRKADLVLTTSEPLRDFVKSDYLPVGEVISMPSTIDRAVFHPRDKAACRRALSLPENARLVGTAGGLYRDKGIAALYDAWKRLEARDRDVHLVLAGPHEAGFPPPTGERVHVLGALPHQQVAQLFCALDVGVICILDTAFGRYCFPQKAYEMLACQLPVVAAAVGAMQGLFAATSDALYQPGNAFDLASKIAAQLSARRIADVAIDDWQTVLGAIEPHIRGLAKTTATS
jgi:teichuronic acid biosynthesis glycosyltransferase TuaC